MDDLDFRDVAVFVCSVDEIDLGLVQCVRVEVTVRVRIRVGVGVRTSSVNKWRGR